MEQFMALSLVGCSRTDKGLSRVEPVKDHPPPELTEQFNRLFSLLPHDGFQGQTQHLLCLGFGYRRVLQGTE